jgi:ArsR family transcriptional regulator
MNDHKENAKVFKAFCDENRLRILELLQTGEKCACILLAKMDISQPTLSHHMRILCDSGMVIPRKDGKWTYYSISRDGRGNAAKLLLKLTEIMIRDCPEGRCFVNE